MIWIFSLMMFFLGKVVLPDYQNEGSINYFDLVQLNEKRIDLAALDGSVAAIFIFSSKCTLCERNIFFWNRIARKYKNKIRIYGVVLGKRTKVDELLKSKKIHFKLHLPLDLERFIERNNVNCTLSNTILTKARKIIYFKTGDIDSRDYFDISKILNEGGTKK